MDEKNAGYREIEHTADWELHVWAPDMATLLKESARGMYALLLTSLASEPRVGREFEIPYLDRESLIVEFLSELLFYEEDEGLGFDGYQISFDGDKYKFSVSGAPIAKRRREIKAVTYHGMEVCKTVRGLEVNIVFDV